MQSYVVILVLIFFYKHSAPYSLEFTFNRTVGFENLVASDINLSAFITFHFCASCTQVIEMSYV